jgi:hypothetical protein
MLEKTKKTSKTYMASYLMESIEQELDDESNTTLQEIIPDKIHDVAVAVENAERLEVLAKKAYDFCQADEHLNSVHKCYFHSFYTHQITENIRKYQEVFTDPKKVIFNSLQMKMLSYLLIPQIESLRNVRLNDLNPGISLSQTNKNIAAVNDTTENNVKSQSRSNRRRNLWEQLQKVRGEEYV